MCSSEIFTQSASLMLLTPNLLCNLEGSDDEKVLSAGKCFIELKLIKLNLWQRISIQVKSDVMPICLILLAQRVTFYF